MIPIDPALLGEGDDTPRESLDDEAWEYEYDEHQTDVRPVPCWLNILVVLYRNLMS